MMISKIGQSRKNESWRQDMIALSRVSWLEDQTDVVVNPGPST